ncbi:MAG TPA: SPFH domain-containing protein [Candidatus Nanoarchaeia archaeon]|nr:SPFH domain-containing protein [Candidatus Nanoarchaeia archaeon]
MTFLRLLDVWRNKMLNLLPLRIVREYQRGIKFTLGKYTGTVRPGLRIVLPILQDMVKVDIRQKTIDLPAQEVMTKDQVNLSVDGVVFFNIVNPANVVLNVQNLEHQLQNTATAELKEIIGALNMSDALQKRDYIASQLKKRLQAVIGDESVPENQRKRWGIVVRSIQINNVELPENLIRAMAKEAEAEREKKAIVIRAQGEKEASKNYREASEIYSKNSVAFKLRELKTWEEIGKEQNSLMIVVPSNVAVDPLALSALGKNMQGQKNKKK